MFLNLQALNPHSLAAQDPIPGQIKQHPGPVIGTDMDNPDVFEVENIIDFQTSCNWQKFKYLVKWKGWPHEYISKKPVEHLEELEEAIWTFYKQYTGKPRPAGYVHRHPSLQELA